MGKKLVVFNKESAERGKKMVAMTNSSNKDLLNNA